MVAYKAARVVDAISEDVLQDAAVVVEDGRIAWIGSAGEMPDTSHGVMDLGDRRQSVLVARPRIRRVSMGASHEDA
ncbi:MAG: hypothetical protein M3P49_17080, partial [Actinomycetota bacterium]|nr:hypothetical protein [Actinomycetota bacterium]